VTRSTRVLGFALAVAALAATSGGAESSAAPARGPALHAIASTPLPSGHGAVDSLAVSPDGRRALALVGDPDQGDRQALVSLDLTTSPASILGVNTRVHPAAFDQILMRGNTLAYATQNATLKVIDAVPARPKVVATVHLGKGDEVDAMALRPDGRVLYVARGGVFGHDHVLVFHVGRKGIPRKPVDVFAGEIGGLTFTHSGHRLLVSHGDALRVYDVRRPDRPRLVSSFDPGVLGPGQSVVAPGGHTAFVLGGDSADVAKVDLQTGKVLARKTVAAYDDQGGIALSPDGSRLVMLEGLRADDQRSVFVLDRRLHLLQRLTGPCYPNAVTVSTGGPTLGDFYVGDTGICGRPAQVTPFVQ
jgi:DNA-binding beta-propeller fold protein YncE